VKFGIIELDIIFGGGAFVNFVKICTADLPNIWSHCSFSEPVTKHSNSGVNMDDHAKFKSYTTRLMKL
jgi:hypothetical protein